MPSEKPIAQIEEASGAKVTETGIRDVRGEALALRTQSLQISEATRDPKKEEEIRPLQKTQGTAYYCDLFIAHVSTLLVPEAHPQVSKFVKSSLHMYNICHIQDDLLASNRQFCQTNKQWNPLVSRYYYGVLDVIQTLRAMDEADILDFSERLFLHEFLRRFPPESLTIASPLMTYFQSICVSECQYPTYGPICPILPHPNQYHPRHNDGTPAFTYVNYQIPNIPGIVGTIQQLGSEERQQQIETNRLSMPFTPTRSFIGHNAVAQAASLNGFPLQVNFQDMEDDLRWYFTSPGMEYPNEADKESLKAFSQQVYKYQFADITRADTFGTIQSYLCMDRPESFAYVLATMSSFNKHFVNSGSLAHCPPRGVCAGQVVVTLTPPKALPRYYGDPNGLISPKLTAVSVNHTLSQAQAMYGICSKINSIFAENGAIHPLDGIGTSRHEENVLIGPFWDSSDLQLRSGTDEGFLRYSEIIRTRYYLEKPEN